MLNVHLKSLNYKNGDSEIIFSDKHSCPDVNVLKKTLGKTYKIWESVVNYTLISQKDTKAEWNYSGEKFGWSLRIKDKKRVVVYLLPRNRFFIFSIVLGEKSVHLALESKICKEIKDAICSSKVYAEGRGIRINIRDKRLLMDLKTLIDVK